MPDYLILGCGYTGLRVAERLVQRGQRVTCTNRRATEFSGATCLAWDGEHEGILDRYVSPQTIVLYSLPATDITARVLSILAPFRPARIVYLSTTGVYGDGQLVDETTQPAPNTTKDAARLATENAIRSGPWSSLVLRPAAIYGPGRGVHTGAHTGVFRPPPGGDRLVSRIHVEDLAEQSLLGLDGDLTGAFPIADEEPCPSRTVAQYAFELLGVPFLTEARESRQRDQGKSGRQVDGSAYRRAIQYNLQYPTYREGVKACLAAEGASANNSPSWLLP